MGYVAEQLFLTSAIQSEREMKEVGWNRGICSDTGRYAWREEACIEWTHLTYWSQTDRFHGPLCVMNIYNKQSVLLSANVFMQAGNKRSF